MSFQKRFEKLLEGLETLSEEYPLLSHAHIDFSAKKGFGIHLVFGDSGFRVGVGTNVEPVKSLYEVAPEIENFFIKRMDDLETYQARELEAAEERRVNAEDYSRQYKTIRQMVNPAPLEELAQQSE